MGRGMRAGKRPKTNRAQGGGSMQRQLAQAQALQKEMEQAQAELETAEFSATAGGGAIAVKVNGKKEVLSITIQPEVVDPDDVEMLQDLVVAAVNEANRQVDEASENRMSQLTGGFNIPGII